MLQFYVHRDRVPLIGPDARVILVEGVALLLVRANDLFKGLQRQVMPPRGVDAVYQCLDIRPAVLIQRDSSVIPITSGLCLRISERNLLVLRMSFFSICFA